MPAPRNIATRHARSRSVQRYGVDLSLDEIERQIASGEAQLFEKENRDIWKYFVRADGQFVPIVFNRTRRVVITTLPPDAKDVIRGRMKLSEQKTWPSWCCPQCGDPIGWFGRIFSFLRFKPFHLHTR